MAKTATQTRTKAATKSANAKSSSEGKPKRAPSEYNKFMAANLKPWREANPGKSVKDSMKAVAAMWKDAPENPNRGQEPKSKKKAPKKTAAKPKRQEKLPASSDTEAPEANDEDEDE
ncbi:hypothetical protein K474DRAFT_1649945 [Panus rudis PR-1116 ss-1]|nr:hypothetical protein K474DRAFT_1649945 [Panus rudis PR-1116 ss-1]